MSILFLAHTAPSPGYLLTETAKQVCRVHIVLVLMRSTFGVKCHDLSNNKKKHVAFLSWA